MRGKLNETDYMDVRREGLSPVPLTEKCSFPIFISDFQVMLKRHKSNGLICESFIWPHSPSPSPPPPFPHSCHAGHVFVSTSSSIFGVAVISTCFLALETRSSIQLISCHFAFWPLIFLLRHNRIICWFIYPHFPLCRSVFNFFSVPVPSQLYSSPPLVRV